MLVASAFLILGLLLLSHALRAALLSHLPGTLATDALLEFVASAEMCAVFYELIIVTDHYGEAAYFVFVLLLTVWWGQSWGGATACPYTLVEDLLEGGARASHVAVKTAAQFAGGLSSFRLVKRLWQLEVVATHVGRGVDACSADLTVTPAAGFLIEMALTCACRLISRAVGESKPRYASFVDSFFSTSMVMLALSTSGGYFNPVLATGVKWGCRGHTGAEHIFVYWAGAVIGSVISLMAWKKPIVKTTLVKLFTPISTIVVTEEKKED